MFIGNKEKIILPVLFLLILPFWLFSQENLTENHRNINQALKQYRTICSLDSNNFAAYNNLGNCYFLKSDLDSAETCYLAAEQILDSLEIYHQTADTAKLKLIQKHHAGVLLNLGTLYTAANEEEKAFEMYGQVVHDSTDFEKVCELLGLPLAKADYVLGQKPNISAAKVKSMVTKTAKKKLKPKKTQSKTKTKRKKKSRNTVRKGTKPEGEVSDVFYWIY